MANTFVGQYTAGYDPDFRNLRRFTELIEILISTSRADSSRWNCYINGERSRRAGMAVLRLLSPLTVFDDVV